MVGLDDLLPICYLPHPGEILDRPDSQRHAVHQDNPILIAFN